jgi:hypothetical protein
VNSSRLSLRGDRLIAVGDYNAKHQYWGSKLINPIKAERFIKLSLIRTGYYIIKHVNILDHDKKKDTRYNRF